MKKRVSAVVVEKVYATVAVAAGPDGRCHLQLAQLAGRAGYGASAVSRAIRVLRRARRLSVERLPPHGPHGLIPRRALRIHR